MKKALCILLILSTMFTTVFASSAQSQLDETNKNIQNQKEQLNQIKADKKDTLAEIDNLDKQITTTESTISALELEISDLEEDITLATSNIEYAQKQYDAKNAIRKKRVAAYYENGTTSYWEMLLTSESMSDYLYRKQILEDVKEMAEQVRALDRRSRTIALGNCAPAPGWSAVPALSNLYPGMTISSEVQEIPQLIEGLRDGTYQIITLPYALVDEAFYCQAAQKETLFLCLPPKHPCAQKVETGMNLEEIDGETDRKSVV